MKNDPKTSDSRYAGGETESEHDDADSPEDLEEEAEAAVTTAEEDAAGELDAEAVELQAELETLNDRHLRLVAEFDNFRRRAQNEMRESWDRAQADLVRRLLDGLDDLQRVTRLDPEATTVASLLEGVGLVERKFVRELQEAGVEAIDPEGETFDPQTMEAVMRVPVDSDEDDDRVDQVFQKGYRLKNQLVRPARVSVRKHE